MTLTRDDPTLAHPVRDRSQLIAYFEAAAKPPERFLVGTEHEKLPLYADSLAPVPFEGELGIEALLAQLRDRHGFAPIHEDRHLIALERDGASITLEPGGQLELSGAPFQTLHQTCREFQQHVSLMKHVSEPFGIVWLGLGVHPLARVEDVPRMPRERHDQMREHLRRTGTLGLTMMHATCGVQASFDFADQADAGRKLRVANAVSPVVTAMYANSSITLGQPNGYESWRAHIWRHTDPARCGFPPGVFADDFFERGAYEVYTDWALDVPMMFVAREGRHLSVGRRTFREVWQAGDPELTLADWNLHLTTLFPEVRLKRVIELRGADAVPPGLVCALPAFWKGLFYDEAALEASLERTMHWTCEQVSALHGDVARRGLTAETPDGPAVEVARELLDLAESGLERLAARDREGRTEARLLEPLRDVVDRGASPGRQLLDRWFGALGGRVDLLVEYSRY